MKQQVNTRGVILDILTEINEKGRFTHAVLAEALRKYQYLSKEDRAFISCVVRGTVERKITLDYIIGIYSAQPVRKLKPVIRNILRMSTFQLVYLQNMKPYAVCDEAVKLTVKRGYSFFRSYVNAVLRKVSSEAGNIPMPDRTEDIIKYLSVVYSTPEWIVAKWINDYGIEQTEIMLDSQFAPHPLTIRCNSSLITPDELAKRLRSRGVTVRKNSLLSEALEISDYDYLEIIPEFGEGLFFIQDISSMLVCHVAAPVENSYVIDLCAAPGGKSMHMAELLKKTGYVEARDISEFKVSKIRENIDRLNLENVAAVVMDAGVTDELSLGKADIVIADLPCSGLGVMGKKPDIKYNATPEKCRELVQLQRKILKASADYVKPGGVLIYSTCTVNKDENTENVRWFTDNFPFRLESINEYIPRQLWSDTTGNGYIQLFPGGSADSPITQNSDGFFIARLVRK